MHTMLVVSLCVFSFFHVTFRPILCISFFLRFLLTSLLYYLQIRVCEDSVLKIIL